MNSFIVLPEHIEANRLTLIGDEAHHCIRVLRMQVGEALIAIDGVGCAYRARIVQSSNEGVECAIEERIPGMNEPSREVTLGVSLLKHSAKFDIVVEKAVELGVRTIIPLITAHTERQNAKTQRWREIAASAAKQSLRCRIPDILEPVPFGMACASTEFRLKVIAHEKASAGQAFSGVLRALPEADLSPMLVLIGPEGGFSEDECVEAERLGVKRMWLGPRRLRTETAAILAIGLALDGN